MVVNGQDLGIYFVVEELKSRFLQRNFTEATGNLYEGTACDFRPEFIGGFEQKTNLLSSPVRTDLQAVYDIVQSASDAEFESQLSAVVNLDEFYRFWAVESLLWHRDGYGGNSNNYYIYANPADDGRFHFLPWGPDGILRSGGPTPRSVLASGAIANRLYSQPATRARYYQELDDLLTTVWDPAAINTEVDRVTEILSPYTSPTYPAEILDLKDKIAGRQGVIEAAIENGYPDWTVGMRALPCRVPAGTVQLSFATTWNTLGQNFFSAGSGTMNLSLGTTPLTTTAVGARSGPSGNGRIEINTTTAQGSNFRFNVPFPSLRFFDPFATVGLHPLTRPPLSVNVIQSGAASASYELGSGTWTFEEVGTSSGAPIKASFTATLFSRYGGTRL